MFRRYVRDATASMAVAFSLFNFPAKRPKLFNDEEDDENASTKGLFCLVYKEIQLPEFERNLASEKIIKEKLHFVKAILRKQFFYTPLEIPKILYSSLQINHFPRCLNGKLSPKSSLGILYCSWEQALQWPRQQRCYFVFYH